MTTNPIYDNIATFLEQIAPTKKSLIYLKENLERRIAKDRAELEIVNQAIVNFKEEEKEDG